jgi:mannan endo-1,4-beta-mannosidase
MKYILCLIIPSFLLLSSCKDKQTLQAPVNPAATHETRALLKFLYDIKGLYTLSGQHNYINTGSKYTEEVKRITGKYPVVWGSDFSFCVEGDNYYSFQHCGPLNLSDPSDSAYFLDLVMEEARQQMVEEIISRYRQGYIITLMWHGCFPADGDCCPGNSIWAMENRPSDSTWNQLTTDGTELNTLWKEQMDKIAGYLLALQERNIPILWRPYHEMNGVWFWWCNKKGEDGFRKLWIMTYDYLTNHHKLNNLIWVWNTNAPRDIPGDEAFDYELFYPGDEYVDVLAADVYRSDYRLSHQDDLLSLAKGKPIALGEVGGLPTAEILEIQPYWEWFMSWGFLLLRSNPEEKIRELYGSPQVLTLDEVRRNRKGNLSVVSGQSPR